MSAAQSNPPPACPSWSRRRALQALATGSLGAASGWAQAQANSGPGTAADSGASTASDGAARLVFGIPPGAAGTTLANGLIAEMARHWTPPIKLEHVLGREARRSAEVVKGAAPNGLTILHAQSALVSLFPLTYQRLGYAPLEDFTPLAGLAGYTFVLAVGPMVPKDVKTVDDYLRWVADNPAGRQYGVILRGSQGHLAGLALARAKDAGIQPTIYGGTTPIVRDLVAGALPAAFIVSGNRSDLFADGTLRALAVTSAEGWAPLPSVPSLAELGVEGLDLSGWYGWFGPAGMASEVSGRLVAALDTTMRSPAYAAMMDKLQFKPLLLNPDQVRERIVRELANNAKVVQQARLSLSLA